MNADLTSVFDLSPSEKLQLVEDLWDDLAATPEAVPVYDWQKEELARRKANLMKNPASGLTWAEVQRGSGAAMAAELIVTSETGQDPTQAYDWYESQRVGLGEEFLTRVDACIQSIVRNPELHRLVIENYRRDWCGRFPTRSFMNTRMVRSLSIASFTLRATRRNGAIGSHNRPSGHGRASSAAGSA